MKKGFSLVELLAVIVILGIIATITIPKIQDLLIESRDNAYDLVVNQLETRAKDYVIDKKLDANITNTVPLDVYLSTLITANYIKSSDLEDPRYKNQAINPDLSYVHFTLENGSLKSVTNFTTTVNP
ncbi:MAG: type II secretion system protein [Bacilli bacterium]|nr:type II secretion system protein [Bacilli bacterium]